MAAKWLCLIPGTEIGAAVTVRFRCEKRPANNPSVVKVTGTQGTKQTATSYAVTVTGAATNWQVDDVQLASAGNT